MDVTKVVKMRKGLGQSISCPYCGSIEINLDKIIDEKLEAKTDDSGYPVKQEAYKEIQNCTCKNCSQKYLIDYGRSTYTIYTPPISQNNIRDIVCLAKFESEWHNSFSIYAAVNPSKRPKFFYYIEFEEDSFPIFITRKQIQDFIKNHKEAMRYAYCHWMTRYR